MCALLLTEGYVNENGTIHVKRLQVILDEMAHWEREVFEKEYADLNWYKGKQAKHVKEMELGRKRSKLVLTSSQRAIFDEVKEFVLSHRAPGSLAHQRKSRLAQVNDFNAADRAFIGRVAYDLHLSLTCDEYNEQD